LSAAISNRKSAALRAGSSIVARTTIDAPDRKAVLFQFEVPAEQFLPGLYTCQVNIIDEAAGTFAFPRLELLVR
jgi:hypothetical protein